MASAMVVGAPPKSRSTVTITAWATVILIGSPVTPIFAVVVPGAAFATLVTLEEAWRLPPLPKILSPLRKM